MNRRSKTTISHPVANPPPGDPPRPASLETASLHTQLHALSKRQGDESSIRETFRRIIMDHTGAVGVGHVVSDEQGNWDLQPGNASGRLPRRHDFVEKFARCCHATIARQSIQIEQFLGLESIYAPIHFPGYRPEVLLVLTEEKNSAKTLLVLEIVSDYFTIWLKENCAERSGWKLTSLAALIELVSQIEKQDTVSRACQVAASEMKRHLGCEQLAVGMIHKGKLVVEAISGNATIHRQGESSRVIETALNECLLRNDIGLWPASGDSPPHLLLAHEQMATHFQCEAVMSFPLTTVDDQVVGAAVITGDRDLMNGDRLPNFVRAASPRVANALEVVTRAQCSRIRRWMNTLQEQAATVKGRIWCGVAAVLLGIMMVPVPYRIRCQCHTEATQRRFAVAPFDGRVQLGYVRPGDRVAEGQLLAEMDGKPLRFELAAVIAELNQARKKREIELSDRNVPASMLADLESQRLAAKKNRLELQQGQVEIRSPLEGVVISGSLEKAEGASVDTGKVLFEVAPLQSLIIQISIPAEEVAHVQKGQSARVWIKGLESRSFTGRINRIHPDSELRDGRNVFVAEIMIDNPDQRLRPGMQGYARIDGRARPLAWNLFHKPWHYVTSRLAWW